MKSAVILSVAAVAAAADPIRPWVKPSAGDSRGPCPMMNTLANHGYLPHNGRNITAKAIGQAVAAALNADPAFGEKPMGLFTSKTGKSMISLEELDTPHVMQHIASLTRPDVKDGQSAAGQSFPFGPRIDELLADSPSDALTIDSIAKSRLRVEAASQPTSLTFQENIMAYFEAALVLFVMTKDGAPSALTFPADASWQAPKDQVKTWLTEERLPVELGWKRSERTLNVVDLVPVLRGIWSRKSANSPPFWQAWLPWITGVTTEPRL